jgi:N-acetylglucosaminyldiphosphoundecaprenol N-acetyl-beta-D-mannosaminyltransferase
MSYKQRKVWNILGLVFDEITLSETTEYTKNAVINNKDCFISTPNLNFVITANSNDIFFNSVIESDLSVADGMPIIWVAKLLGIPIRERVAGSTLFEDLRNQVNESEKIKVFFFGGLPGVARQAHENLNKTESSLISCGHYDPGFVDVDLMSEQTTLDYINEANPDFIVVALGAEKGQKWILKNKEKLNAPVISHLGAVINFVAGTVTRAPALWQNIGLEWLWRIKQEPNLWKRYFFDGIQFCKLITFNVLPLAFYDRYLKNKYKTTQALLISTVEKKNRFILEGSYTFTDIELASIFLQQNVTFNEDVTLDMSKLQYIDAAAIGQLLLFQLNLKKEKQALLMTGLSSRLKTILTLNNVKHRFNLIDK